MALPNLHEKNILAINIEYLCQHIYIDNNLLSDIFFVNTTENALNSAIYISSCKSDRVNEEIILMYIPRISMRIGMVDRQAKHTVTTIVLLTTLRALHMKSQVPLASKLASLS